MIVLVEHKDLGGAREVLLLYAAHLGVSGNITFKLQFSIDILDESESLWPSDSLLQGRNTH